MDFEPTNEFEFDLSDVDVAAFESVTTEDTTNTGQQDHSQEQNSATSSQQLQHHQLEPLQQLRPSPIKSPPQDSSPKEQHERIDDHDHALDRKQIQTTPQYPGAQLVSASGSTTGSKILLVPINFLPRFSSNNLTSSKQISFNEALKPPTPKQISFNETLKPPTPKQTSFNDALRVPTPNSHAVISSNEIPKRKPCNCTKSQCLKLYCDCFANGEFCSGCNCTNCFNSLSKEKERQRAITQCLERNPEAFRPKIGKAVKLSVGEPAPDMIERRHTKGCNCKRSGCLKNYCECYEAKILCSNLCKCCGCKNYEESFERKSLMQLANSTSDNARGILKNLLPTNNNSNTGKEFTKCFITDKVIHASLVCLLQSAQQAEKDGIEEKNIPDLIQTEMGKCLKMIVDSATESQCSKKR